MYRKRSNRERRYRRTRAEDYRPPRRGITSAFRTPAAQIGLLAVIALVVFLILQLGRGGANAPAGVPREISVGDAYTRYQNGVFLLDVRTQEEWDDFHVPNTTLIPLDQLPSRLGELPRDREIVVVCRSGNRSQQGRDILLDAGFGPVSSMRGGLNEWRASGYPVEP